MRNLIELVHCKIEFISCADRRLGNLWCINWNMKYKNKDNILTKRRKRGGLGGWGWGGGGGGGAHNS